MKKVLIFISLILFSFFYHLDRVDAQIPTPPFNFDCGFANTQINKCCNINPIDPNKMKNQGVGGYGNNTDVPDTNMQLPILSSIVTPCFLGQPKGSGASCICEQSINPSMAVKLDELCNKLTSGNEKTACMNCASGGGISTGIGCIPADPGNFITDFLLNRLIGLAGIFAMICIFYSAFQLQTSRGNPEKIKKAQELLTSCIMGLMLIIFSVFILKLIGVDILKIPGFQ